MNKKGLLSLSSASDTLPADSPDKIGLGEEFPIEIEIFREGSFEHAYYGSLNFTEEYIDKIISNFEKGYCSEEISFDLDHQPAKAGAVAWLKAEKGNLYKKKKIFKNIMGEEQEVTVLVARAMLNSYGYELIRGKRYKYFSSEFIPNYESREIFSKKNDDGDTVEYKVKDIGPVLVSGGLTNRPFITMLSQIQLSELSPDEARSLVDVSDSIAGIKFAALSSDEDDEMYDDPDPEVDVDEEDDDVDEVEMAKRSDTFSPPQSVRNNAKRALEVRASKPPSQRGMTAVGLKRANDLANGRSLSYNTIKRMKAYFDRHQKDKQGETWKDKGKGWQAWMGWGGDSGWSWARGIVNRVEGPQKNSDLDTDGELAPETESGQNTFNFLGENKMNLSEILKKNEGVSLEDQIKNLSEATAKFSDSDAQVAQVILLSLAEQKRKDDLAARAMRDAELAQSQAHQLSAKLSAVEMDLKRHQAQSYAKSVQIYCEELRADGVTEATLTYLSDKFSQMSEESLKFSCGDSDMNLMQFVKELIKTLPSTAFLDTTESFSQTAERVVEVTPEKVVEDKQDEQKLSDPGKPAWAHEGHIKFCETYQYKIADIESLKDSIDKNGNLIAKL